MKKILLAAWFLFCVMLVPAVAQSLYPSALPGWFPSLHLTGAAGGGNQCIHADNTGNLTGTGSDCGSGGGGSGSLSALTSATTTNSIENSNWAQTWNFGTLTTENALSLTTSAKTTGHILSLTNTSTASSSSVLHILDSTTSTGRGVFSQVNGVSNSGYGGYFTNTGTGNTGYAGYFNNTSTAANAYAGYFNGQVGMSQPLTYTNGGTGSSVGDAYSLYGLPIIQTNALHTYGDSITQGFLVTPTTDYPYYLSQEMGAVVTNNAVGGDQACDLSDHVMDDENPGPALTYQGSNPLYTIMIGTNDARFGGVGAYEVNYNNCVKSASIWMSSPTAYKVNANSAGCTTTGSWTAGTGAYSGNGQPAQSKYSNTNGSTMTCTITTYGGPLNLTYRTGDSWTGTFTYAIDGGSPVTQNSFPVTPVSTHNGGTASIVPVTINGLAAGSHTVVYTVTSGTGGNNFVEPVFISTPSPNPVWGGPQVFNLGVIEQCGNAAAAATLQYNNDALADVNALFAQGYLNYFSPTRNNIGSAASSFADACGGPGLHPSALGHQLITEGIAATMQFVPTSAAATVNWPIVVSGSTNVTGISLQNTTTGNYEGVTYVGPDTWWSAVGNGGTSVTNLRNSWFVYDSTTGYVNFLINGNGNVGIGNTAQFVGCNPGSTWNAEICGTFHVTGATTGASFAATGNISTTAGVITQGPALAATTSNYMESNSALLASTTGLNPGLIVYGGNYGIDLGYNATSSTYRTRVVSGADIALSFSSGAMTAQSSATDYLVVKGTTGRVGIGTVSPADLLDVAGAIGMTSTGAIPANGLYLSAANTLDISSNTTKAIEITSGQIVRIPAITSDSGLTDATVCEDTTNHGLFAGSGTLGICLGTSSARFKTNIVNLPSSLQKIMALRPVNFNFKDASHGDPKKRRYGFIAEDSVSVYPDLVEYDKDGKINTFDYLGLLAPMVKAIQEQQHEIDALKRQITK